MEKLDRVNTIKDEAEKINLLKKVATNISGNRGSVITLSNFVSELIVPRLTVIRDNLENINKNLTTLVGVMSDFVYKKSETTAANQDTQLTDALTTAIKTNEAFVGEGGSAVAVSANEPVLIALGKIKDCFVEGLNANTEAIKQTSKQEQALQSNNTKAIIANERKRQQAEDRNRLLNPNKNKEQVININENKSKIAPPKFPIDAKQFMSGLGNILKGILNPIALIAGIFMHLLPYIILGIAFFKGLWSKLSEQTKEKIIEIRDKIIFYACLAFLLFKGPALLINTLQLAWHIIRVGYAVAKWSLEIAFHALKTLFLGIEHTMKLSGILFDKMCTIIEHAANIALNTFKMVLAIGEYLLIAGGVVLVVAAIVLLIGGVIALFVLFGDKIIDAVKKIVECFKMIGGMVYDATVGFAKMIGDTLITLITGLFGNLIKAVVNGIKWIFGGNENEKNKTETSVKDGVTKNLFTATLEPITKTLNELKNCLSKIEDKTVTAAANMIPYNNNSNISNVINADNTKSMINTSYVSSAQKENIPDKNLMKDINTITEILKKWNDERERIQRNKLPNTVLGIGA